MPTPIIDKKCTNCDNCIEICPMECFENNNGTVVVSNGDACIGCKACEVQCPSAAILVKD